MSLFLMQSTCVIYGTITQPHNCISFHQDVSSSVIKVSQVSSCECPPLYLRSGNQTQRSPSTLLNRVVSGRARWQHGVFSRGRRHPFYIFSGGVCSWKKGHTQALTLITLHVRALGVHQHPHQLLPLYTLYTSTTTLTTIWSMSPTIDINFFYSQSSCLIHIVNCPCATSNTGGIPQGWEVKKNTNGSFL